MTCWAKESKLSNKKLEINAARIANMIAKTDTDDRGVLLSHVATLLRDKSQNYTATLIYKAAVEYGVPKNCEPDMPN